MPRWFHVTSSLNRASIREYGLDWRRMTRPGIAGSATPEVEGVFVCDEHTADFFVRFTTTDSPVDVWAVDGVDESELLESAEGFHYVPRPIGPAGVALHAADRTPPPEEHDRASGAYGSTLTITLDDGTVLRDDEIER